MVKMNKFGVLLILLMEGTVKMDGQIFTYQMVLEDLEEMDT